MPVGAECALPLPQPDQGGLTVCYINAPRLTATASGDRRATRERHYLLIMEIHGACPVHYRLAT